MPQLVDLVIKFFKKLLSSLEGSVEKSMKSHGGVAQVILSLIRKIITNISKTSNSLSTTVVLLILALLLIPLVLMGTTNYLRSRALLEEQYSLQLSNISAYQSDQLEEETQAGGKLLDNLAAQPILNSTLRTILDVNTSASDLNLAYFQLESLLAAFKTPIQTEGEKVFDQIFIIRPDGKVIDSSETSLKNQDLGKVSGISEIIGKRQSIAVFNPSPLYFNDLVIFSASPVSPIPGLPPLTIIGVSHTTRPLNNLTGAGSYFQFAHAYLLTKENILVGMDPTSKHLIQILSDANYSQQLKSILDKGGGFGSINLQKQESYIVSLYYQLRFQTGTLFFHLRQALETATSPRALTLCLYLFLYLFLLTCFLSLKP